MVIVKKKDYFVFEDTGEVIEPKFDKYNSPEDYKSEVKYIVPMTADKIEDKDKLEVLYNSNEYFAEEKLDGTRATFHFTEKGIRVFSRRISKKTGWFAENSDLVPHIRDWEIPKELIGTIIDGELFIPNRPFKDVSSTMNCNWDKAIDRQLEKGFVHLKAFDILYYKGVNIKAMPLIRRKDFLHEVLEKLKCPYIEEIEYFINNIDVEITNEVMEEYEKGDFKYPNLMEELNNSLDDFPNVGDKITLSKKAYYEYIVCNNGEGIILKNIVGKYYPKRTKEYIKVKKFITKDVVVIGYSEPTKEVDLDVIKTPIEEWEYWYHPESDSYWEGINHQKTIDECNSVPVTKFACKGWIGTIQFGIVVTDEEIKEWENRNKEKAIIREIGENKLLYIGETSGLTDEEREDFTKNKDKYMGSVIEIKAQEVIKKTGKLRHPNFLRHRFDKNLEDCIWKDHIL